MIAKKQPLEVLRTLPWGQPPRSTPAKHKQSSHHAQPIVHRPEMPRMQRAIKEHPKSSVFFQISVFLNIFLPDKNVLCRNENGCQKPIAHLLKDPITLLY